MTKIHHKVTEKKAYNKITGHANDSLYPCDVIVV